MAIKGTVEAYAGVAATADPELADIYPYESVRRLPSGEIAGTQRMLFTWALFVGLTSYGYRTRFCYEHKEDATAACEQWDGTGDPPGPWIKEKPANRLNPNWSPS